MPQLLGYGHRRESNTYRFWPKNIQDYREVNEEYGKEIKKLSEKILGRLSEGLGLRHEALKEGLGGETVEYLMMVIFYRPYQESQDQDVKPLLELISCDDNAPKFKPTYRDYKFHIWNRLPLD
ncbi:hypothetical protein Bca52824_019929 [Brassica carinata]|uniref:Uncharacterized protein n=1 Tax=Brassica carinata TaxID=52824 RepID=A0A8X8B015_BRACI|nr:hypothetical protein Bca52824_019929 [Brassica carinata]